jgi:uncharacterized protein involved in oxidation of intracellular sulfur
MKLGSLISQTDPETVFNALRLANYSLKQGDTVRIFLACGTCLKLRESEGWEICPLSTLKDLYEIARDSDRLVTF